MKDNLSESNENDEIGENLIAPDGNIFTPDLDGDHFNGKKINIFLYIIPEVIFIACFLSGIFYKKSLHIFIFIPYFLPILLFNCFFFIKRNLLCLNNYLLLTKFLSIETLIFYPIFIIHESRIGQEDYIFIIIFIIGAISGLFSLIYLFLYFYIFQNGLSELKKIYFLYFELLAIIVMHPLFIYYYYIEGPLSINSAVLKLLVIAGVFFIELLLFLINSLFLCLEPDNYCLKIMVAIIKIILYISFELVSLVIVDRNLNYEIFIYLSIRIIFNVASLFCFIIFNIIKNKK